MLIYKLFIENYCKISYKNWIDYGNPDGALQTKWGIALPKWLVEEGNHLYVLGVYGLIFGIMLPAVVGNWWYKSIQYTGESVLIKTTKLFEVRKLKVSKNFPVNLKINPYFFFAENSKF